ncbi:MAG: hypothetical protein AAB425_01835 [Bdellovibrionota bacterium]
MELRKLQKTLSVLVANGEAISRSRLISVSDGLFERIVRVLRGDYLATACLVDALDPSRMAGALFERLTIEYLVAYDTGRYRLAEIGSMFPHFLITHAVESEAPGISELARLEYELMRLLSGQSRLREITLTACVRLSWESRLLAIPCLPGTGVEKLRLNLVGNRTDVQAVASPVTVD